MQKIGDVIKGLRKNVGLSQKQLVGNVIDVGHLGRIERNKVAPSMDTIEILIERLGHNPDIVAELLVDEHFAAMRGMKEKLDNNLIKGDIAKAELIIEFLESDEKFMKYKKSKQYILMCKANVLLLKEASMDEIQDVLLESIKIYIPEFVLSDAICKFLLTKQEIRIINMMALVLYNQGNLSQVIEIMYYLKQNMDDRFLDAAAKGADYSLIISSLAKYLGLAERYDEAIEMCDIGINMCLETGAVWLVPLTVCSKGQYLRKIGKIEEGNILIIQSHASMTLFKQDEYAEKLKVYAEENGIDLIKSF